ncbi:MAG: hypothetical protein G01um101491_337 [Parcubacteria group bacterium Gr01-1014_91]|nr:MAG: hypothetical protein G01um101491_337 [Parcubacteria group bacterium Gr01-1014_91]
MRIVCLVFATNSAYVNVVEVPPKGVEVFPDKGIWKWPGVYPPDGTRTTLKIGESRYARNSRSGIIGVYDVDNLKHLDSMVHDAVESQRDYSNAD